jgi:transcriptional regulator with XRE-family HTH domain
MPEPRYTFTEKVMEARRRRGMTQSDLADTVGCKQSAISMFERGNAQALAIEKQEAIAKLLEIPWHAPDNKGARDIAPARNHNFCPQFECPSNLVYRVGTRRLSMPRAPSCTDGIYCRYCGEVSETRCPACKTIYTQGACCSNCGYAFIACPDWTEAEWLDWQEAHNRTAREIPIP